MSTSSGADRRARRRRGFTLVEALVALVVAGLILPALARAFAGAWGAARAPMEVVSAVTLARDVAAGAPLPPDARARGFRAERGEGAATLLVLPSGVAPAPRGTGDADPPKPSATPAAIRLAIPKTLGVPDGGPARVALRRVTAAVRTPAGRRVTVDSVRLVDAPP